MGNVKWIFFDCMETIIDMTELPSLEDYAAWTYHGSGVEEYWEDFTDFFQDFSTARKVIEEELPRFKEYDIYYRFKFMAGFKLDEDQLIEEVARKLSINYWQLYLSRTYIEKEIKETIRLLSQKYKLAVVSNFMYTGGIEKLLEIHEIAEFFDFVITSVNEGWRKPHPNIYNKAIQAASVLPRDILFIGDDYFCDYLGPRQMDLKAFYYDKNKKNCELRDRIEKISDLTGLL